MFLYGEEKNAKQIARKIVKIREDKPIETTFELVDIIKSAMPSKALNEKQHPAKRVFQAIRIEVNHELTGLETAEMLTLTNNKVTIVEMADSIGPGVWMQHVDDIMPRLKDKKVKFHTSRKLTEIGDSFITVEDKKGNKEKMDADYVVLSLGAKSDNALYEEIKGMTENVYLIGDAEKVGRIADATRSAFECVKGIK